MDDRREEGPTDVVNHIMKDLERDIWEKAARHHACQGLGQGADFTGVKQHINKLKKVGKYQDYGALLVAEPDEQQLLVQTACASAECWIRTTTGTWGTCSQKTDHKDYE
eukprot:4297822-Pyramimonas_sp.AAC.1